MKLTPAVRNAIEKHFDSLKTLLDRIEVEAGTQYKKGNDYLVLNRELPSPDFIKLLGMIHYEEFLSNLLPINKTNLEKIKVSIHKMERSIADIFSTDILPKRTKFIEKWLE